MLNLDLALGEAIGSSIAARILRNLDLNNTHDTDYYYDTETDDTNDSDDSNDDEDEPEFDFNIFGFDIEENDDDDDDENYDIELNIYNGEGVNHRFNNNAEEDEFSFSIKRMSSENISVTDRTFNFYLNTMPSLDKYAMEHCQSHIDNLSKPHGSLGVLEEIVVQCAGISGEELPSSRLKTNLICFTDKKDEADEIDDCIQNDEEPDIENPLADIMDIAESFDVGITFAVIDNSEDSTAVFDFGRMTAEDVSFKVPIIGISILSDISRYEDITEEIREHLLTQDNKLKYEATEFLKHVPKSRRNLISGVIGAIIAAAHNSSLIIVDAGAVDIIARYLEKLCPAIRPYILHATKLVVNDKDYEDDELDGEVVCIAIEVIRAALHCINEMKTFKDTGVNAAIDGIGFYHQSN
ncbi:MAG: nicotinate-nucleotide--dimethylbenzimidazole phosphoribosyltransferase [Selenomonadaceae bacterium]|nr:nicotinate-nucleotide--dimethylbenzimidazole phosphoribosyltransferase [Selenomonadaceae bacterium]MBR1857894.1 nicotinate-nucleotide--dimethylbenzimidazole phosphoribosyltransferase [Selenomonadaceae bacterium]